MIAALGAITTVVIITMIYISQRGFSGSATAASAEPTAVAILDKPRTAWAQIAPTFRGAQATHPPVPCLIIDERDHDPASFLSLTPALTFVCDEPGHAARPIAPGRVVMAVNQAPLNSFKAELLANGADGPWVRAATYGPFVVVDHGNLNGVANVTTVYAGLREISPELQLGQYVDTTTNLGTLGAKTVNGTHVPGVLTFELLSDDSRFDADPLRKPAPPLSAAAQITELLVDKIHLPAQNCTLPFGIDVMLVGSERAYRSGTHNGIDFGCFTTDKPIRSAGVGQVLFVVNDHKAPSAEDREAILGQTTTALDTPFWTLAHVYGNFVVIEHRLDKNTPEDWNKTLEPNPDPETTEPGTAETDPTATSDSAASAGDLGLQEAIDTGLISEPARVITIYSHLDSVAEGIVPGAIVDPTTVIGMAGNTGSSEESQGIHDNHNSIHLHWELHIDDRPLGYGDTPENTGPMYQRIICTDGIGNPPC